MEEEKCFIQDTSTWVSLQRAADDANPPASATNATLPFDPQPESTDFEIRWWLPVVFGVGIIVALTLLFIAMHFLHRIFSRERDLFGFSAEEYKRRSRHSLKMLPDLPPLSVGHFNPLAAHEPARPQRPRLDTAVFDGHFEEFGRSESEGPMSPNPLHNFRRAFPSPRRQRRAPDPAVAEPPSQAPSAARASPPAAPALAPQPHATRPTPVHSPKFGRSASAVSQDEAPGAPQARGQWDWDPPATLSGRAAPFTAAPASPGRAVPVYVSDVTFPELMRSGSGGGPRRTDESSPAALVAPYSSWEPEMDAVSPHYRADAGTRMLPSPRSEDDWDAPSPEPTDAGHAPSGPRRASAPACSFRDRALPPPRRSAPDRAAAAAPAYPARDRAARSGNPTPRSSGEARTSADRKSYRAEPGPFYRDLRGPEPRVPYTAARYDADARGGGAWVPYPLPRVVPPPSSARAPPFPAFPSTSPRVPADGAPHGPPGTAWSGPQTQPQNGWCGYSSPDTQMPGLSPKAGVWGPYPSPRDPPFVAQQPPHTSWAPYPSPQGPHPTPSKQPRSDWGARDSPPAAQPPRSATGGKPPFPAFPSVNRPAALPFNGRLLYDDLAGPPTDHSPRLQPQDDSPYPPTRDHTPWPYGGVSRALGRGPTPGPKGLAPAPAPDDDSMHASSLSQIHVDTIPDPEAEGTPPRSDSDLALPSPERVHRIAQQHREITFY